MATRMPSLPPSVGWSASAFVAAVLARLIRKGLELVADLDDAGTGHLHRLEGLLPSVWRVLDTADAGAIDVIGARPLQDLLDAAYAADDALDDVERALHGAAAEEEGGSESRRRSSIAEIVARKPRSPLRFLLCFSPPRTSIATSGKSSKAKSSNNVNLDALRDALETMAQAAYRCTSAYEYVEPDRNYSTTVSGLSRTEEGAGEEAEQDDIFGREAEVEAILENVKSSDDPHYRLGIGVLPVAGDVGVGKTALVRFVFHHEVVRAEFPVRMWVHVSGELRLRKQIMDQLINGAAGFDDREGDDVIGEHLIREVLTGKRFLLVLDGVTGIAETQWRDLMKVLKPADRRSLIILTTQSETMATVIGTMPTLTLGPLGSKDFWKMFKHFAFGSTDETEECTLLDDDWEDVEEEEEQLEELSPMEQIASELARKMNGLPLPARAIGRALRHRKDDEAHWRNVLEDKIWDEQEDAGNISPALWLSYRHLDPRLKQCFAYCAVFPGNYVFRKEEVVQMWIAQGLLYSDQAATRLEDVGSEFFDELVERCFFQAVGKNGYVMHNSMQELAREVATIRFFMLTDESGDVPQDVRHLTICTNNMSKLKQDLSVQISPIPDSHFLHRLRTILFFADFSDSDDFEDVLPHILSVAKSTRVLGLSSANITYLPPEIAQLRCLRYLNLSGNRIIDLPETLCQLYHLQVLDVRSNSPSLRAPNGILGLIHLRHLCASDFFLSSLQDIHNISNLQELDALHVGGITSRINSLSKMKQLRGMLRIGDLRHVDVSQVQKGILKGMQKLDALQLSWSTCDGQSKEISKDEEVLESLQPHENLRVLKITGYGGVKSPSWLMKATTTTLSNVTKMCLTDCKNLKSLPPLHVMPNLEVLGIRKMHSISKVSTIPQRPDQELFPKLKSLIFEDVPHFTEWSTGSSKLRGTTFPCLCELEIRNCPKLTIFPDLPLSLTVMVFDNVGFELLPRIQDKEPSTEEALAATSKEGRWTSRLTTLQVHQCHKLRCLSSGLLQQQHLLKSLETLSFKNCDNVICDIPDGFKDLTALRDISLYDCPKMLVDKFHTSVRTLEISECFVVRGAWVQEHPFLFSVWKLKVTGCSHVSRNDQYNRIDEPLDWLNSLINVYSLHLENTQLLRLSMFDQLPSLEILDVNGCDGFFSDLYDFSWLERLQTMCIRNCREMSGLPENLCTLPELEELYIENCPAIEVLPENGLPTTLKRLSISKCGPPLNDRCLDDEADGPKISTIDVVYIDCHCIRAKQIDM